VRAPKDTGTDGTCTCTKALSKLVGPHGLTDSCGGAGGVQAGVRPYAKYPNAHQLAPTASADVCLQPDFNEQHFSPANPLLTNFQEQGFLAA
jgi:hypothetical protein